LLAFTRMNATEGSLILAKRGKTDRLTA